jgi:hypothetical protein
MVLRMLARCLPARSRRPQAELKSFEQALRGAGGLANRADAGMRIVPIDQIVGSVGRCGSLRPDFLPRTGPTITARHRRIAEAMLTGAPLPALELYAVTYRSAGGATGCDARSEYYVVDGHHRVAMARRLGQDFLDAHVVEYRVAVIATAPGDHADLAAAGWRDQSAPDSGGGSVQRDAGGRRSVPSSPAGGDHARRPARAHRRRPDHRRRSGEGRHGASGQRDHDRGADRLPPGDRRTGHAVIDQWATASRGARSSQASVWRMPSR